MKRSKKICSYCNFPKVIFKNTPEGKQCYDCYKKQSFMHMIKEKNHKKTRRSKKKKVDDEKGLKELIRQADKKFSWLIRYTNSRLAGGVRIVDCYTCGQTIKMSEAQCGHFIGRIKYFTRWMPDNCRVQCSQCNCGKYGNIEEFKKRLEEESPGITEKLELLSRQVYKPTRSDLQEVNRNLSAELKEALKHFNW